MVPELIAISMPSWGGHSRTTSPAATPLALEEVYIVTYSLPKPHFPLNLTSPLPLELSFSLSVFSYPQLLKSQCELWQNLLDSSQFLGIKSEILKREGKWHSTVLLLLRGPEELQALLSVVPASMDKDRYLVSVFCFCFCFFSPSRLQRHGWQESDRQGEKDLYGEIL